MEMVHVSSPVLRYPLRYLPPRPTQTRPLPSIPFASRNYAPASRRAAGNLKMRPIQSHGQTQLACLAHGAQRGNWVAVLPYPALSRPWLLGSAHHRANKTRMSIWCQNNRILPVHSVILCTYPSRPRALPPRPRLVQKDRQTFTESRFPRLTYMARTQLIR